MKLGAIFSRTILVLWFEKSVRRQEVGMTNVNHSFAKLERLGCYRSGLLAQWLQKIIITEPIWLSASLSFECCFLSHGYNMASAAVNFTFTVQEGSGKIRRRAPTFQLYLVGKKLYHLATSSIRETEKVKFLPLITWIIGSGKRERS